MIFALRALYTLGPGASMNSLLENSSVQSLVYGASIFGLLLVSYGFLLMCNEKFNSELKCLAASDSLTGLYNRRAMEEMAQREISRAHCARTPLLYLMMDLDLFKPINDTLGHAVGDVALKQVAATIRTNLRSQDIVGRLGGDEFAVLLPETDRATGEAIARRISSIIRATPFCYNGRSFELGMSIGIGELRPEQGELASLMRQADEALYQAKRNKRERTA
jgi:diguanylate cyclase (GGDEF)-like protein